MTVTTCQDSATVNRSRQLLISTDCAVSCAVMITICTRTTAVYVVTTVPPTGSLVTAPASTVSHFATTTSCTLYGSFCDSVCLSLCLSICLSLALCGLQHLSIL